MNTEQIGTPDVFILKKLSPSKLTSDISRIYCDGHFFPVSITGVAPQDYGQPIYNLVEVKADASNKLIKPIEPQTVIQKVGAALFISSWGASETGIRTKAQLMHPLQEFSDNDAQRESARFLSSVFSVLLKNLSPSDLDGILQDQLESTSFLD
jgi:hypothetical protein